MIRPVARACVVLVAIIVHAGSAQAQRVTGLRVIRRADRRALIVKLGRFLPDSLIGVSLDASRYILTDLSQHGAAVALEPMTTVSALGCPSARGFAYPQDQICVVLAGGATLDDAHRYNLTLDTITVAGKPARVGGQTVTIGPVAGHVLAPSTHPVRHIVVTYDVDLSHDSTLALRLTFGHGRPVRITSALSWVENVTIRLCASSLSKDPKGSCTVTAKVSRFRRQPTSAAPRRLTLGGT